MPKVVILAVNGGGASPMGGAGLQTAGIGSLTGDLAPVAPERA
jgi:hypothetical protein